MMVGKSKASPSFTFPTPCFRERLTGAVSGDGRGPHPSFHKRVRPPCPPVDREEWAPVAWAEVTALPVG